jgi:6-phosphogluconolactonase
MPSNPNAAAHTIRRFDNPAALCNAITEVADDALRSGVAQRGTASLVLSGGSTPALYLPQIAALDLPWDRVGTTLADERWVAPDHEWSNERFLQGHFFAHAPAARAGFVPLFTADAPLTDALGPRGDAVAALAHPYDLVLLGMGNDGHTASLFPGMPGLAQALNSENPTRLVAVPPPTTAAPAVPRISMTVAELQRSRRSLIVLQGTQKLETLERAWQSGDALRFPVRAMTNAQVFWCA